MARCKVNDKILHTNNQSAVDMAEMAECNGTDIEF